LSRILLALLGFLLSVSPAQGSVLDVFGFGARGMAMGNAQTAVADDVSANHYNPAGLALAESIRIDVGYLHTITQMRLNGADLNVDENPGVQAGLVIPGSIGGMRLAFGLGFYLPNSRLSRIRALPESQPRFVLQDNRTQHVNIATNLAIELFDGLTIGAGLTFLTDTSGEVAIGGTLTPDPSEGDLSNAVDVSFKTARFPSVGLHWQATDALRLGLAWRSQMAVTLDIGANIEAQIVELLGPQPLDGSVSVRSFNTNFFTPHQIFLGASHRPATDTLIALDLGWMHWSAFPTPTAQVTLDFTLETYDTGSLIPPPTAPSDPGFHDTFVVRAGVEQAWSFGGSADFVVRGGYGFEPSPAPDQPGATNYVDLDRHLFSAGLAGGFFENPRGGEHPVQLDLAVQYTLHTQREYPKDSAADPVGDFVANGESWALMATTRILFPW
jgi:long-chain fatty acid transport protein